MAATKSRVTQNSTGMAGHLAEHLVALADVSHRKYFWVSLNIWAALLGAAAGAAAIVLKDLP
mgnify:CR=1 FL=1